MRRIILLAAALAAGCAASPRQERTPVAFDATRDDSCYTVDLFTKVSIRRPGGDVPEAWRAFSGRWGGGAWEGQWCHDLYVLDIRPDGQVELVETYAPHLQWGKRATAFRRTARIDDDGRLRLAYGRVRLEYWVENGMLYGARDETGLGKHRIAMVRRDA